MNQVNDQEVRDILNDKVTYNYLKKAFNIYSKGSTTQEFSEIVPMAIFDGLRYYNGKEKLVSYLVNRVKWACLSRNKLNNVKEIVHKKDAVANPLADTEFLDTISFLPEDLQIIVDLRYRYNMSFREIGDIIGIYRTTARKRHKLALKTLRETVYQSLDQ